LITPITSDSAEHLLDKQWLTVDTNAASPRKGRLYVTWSDFVSPPGNPNGLKAIPIYLASSSDGGATWSAGVEISASDRYNQGSQPVVEPDGTLHVIYYSFNRKGLRIVTSRDGGSTWTKPSTITKMTVGGVPGIRTGSNLPSATVDPVTGTIYAVYQDASRDVADVLLVRSTDGGATWSAPLMVNADPPGQAQFTPAVTALGGQVHVTWTDGNEPSGEPDRYVTAYARSIDGGQTFGPSVAVSASFDMRDAVDTARGRFLGDYQAVVAGGSSVHPVWVDALLGQNDVWSTRVTP